MLLIPGFIKLKEWAYAGFTFAWIAATVAHYLAKDGPRAFSPVVLLILLVVSYVTRQSALGVRSRRNLTLPATDVGGVKREDSQG